MDELLDILDTNGKSTGTTELKSYAHRMGLFHATVHIWFYTSDGQLLLQQRGKEKETHPLLWDVSVAGHVAAGESILLAALREIQEEIGIHVSKVNLQKIGIFKKQQEHANGIKDYEFHHTFLCELKVPLEKLDPQETEVEALSFISLNDFYKDVLVGKNSKMYVPHALTYFHKVFKEINAILN